jgi:hypothetical protein
VETEFNTVNMTAWVHKECDIMDEDALLRLQEHGRTRNRKTNVLCVWMIWSGTTGWALKWDSWEDMGFKDLFLA